MYLFLCYWKYESLERSIHGALELEAGKELDLFYRGRYIDKNSFDKDEFNDDYCIVVNIRDKITTPEYKVEPVNGK